jgi:hypothetical protein
MSCFHDPFYFFGLSGLMEEPFQLINKVIFCQVIFAAAHGQWVQAMVFLENIFVI